MSDNVEFYRTILVRPPTARTLAAAVAVLGAVFGAGSVLVLSPSSSLRVTVAGAAIAAAAFYVVPAYLAAEAAARLGGITRRWTYLMAVIDQVVVLLFSLTIPFADSTTEAWQVMWLGLATVTVINLLMVLMARGRDGLARSVGAALVYPVTVLAAFHLTVGRLVGIPGTLYLRDSIFIVASAFLLLLTIGLYDFLIRANVDMSTFEFTSTLLLGEDRALAGGITTDVHHQALHVENDDTHVFTVPWVHPGPVGGFGGGRLTAGLIDDDTFPLHIPSYHTLDLADPADIDRFDDAPAADTAGQASTLHRRDADGFTLWGRRYDGKTVVYVENRDIDDYEPSIAYDLKEEHPDLCLVDLHNQPVEGDKKWLQHLDRDRRVLADAAGELVAELEDAPLHDYRAGVAGGDRHRCLVEEVDGQRTVLLGVDASDAPAALHAAEQEIDADHVLAFTTDSHENLLDMAAPDYTADELLDAVDAARDDLSDAAAGIGERTVEDVRVLGKDYEGLITTLNVMARIIPITLLLYYVGVVFLIL